MVPKIYLFNILILILREMRDLIYWLTLQRSQWYSREKLFDIQSRKLGVLLKHAYEKVPFYRELYREKMAKITQIKASEILRDLPIVDRRTLADTPLAERTATNIKPEKCLARRTAGTTGEPLTILETKDSAAYWRALYLRRLWSYGVRPGDKLIWLLPSTPATSIRFFSGGILGRLARLDLHFIDMSRNYNENLMVLLNYKPDVLIAQPSDLASIMRKCEELHKKVTVKTIITAGEVLTESFRKRIEYFFDATVYDSYSTVELGNIAWECPTREGYHINIDSIVLELTDVKSIGRGQYAGKAVATCLYRFATPIIRYLVGDSIEITDEECSCGRGLPLMSRIAGRVVDCIITKQNELISPYVVLNALQSIETIRKFRVIQHQDYTVEVILSLIPGHSQEIAEEEIGMRLSQVLRGLPYKLSIVDDLDEKFGKKAKLIESLVHH